MSGGPAPTVGSIVHYVSYGTPGGEFASECRAAIVAGIPRIYPSNGAVDLVVLNPTGLHFDRCDYDEAQHGGSWHWPEREGTA